MLKKETSLANDIPGTQDSQQKTKKAKKNVTNMFDIYDEGDNEPKKEVRKDEEEKVEIDGHDYDPNEFEQENDDFVDPEMDYGDDGGEDAGADHYSEGD